MDELVARLWRCPGRGWFHDANLSEAELLSWEVADGDRRQHDFLPEVPEQAATSFEMLTWQP